MRNDDQYYEITDAFLALKDIDDDEVENMLKPNRNVREGKSFSIQTGSEDLKAARDFLNEEEVADDEIEVIDVDADTAEHLKKNTEYIGQGILQCNRCKANRFIDMDLLAASEADEEVYNVEDECPHCHDSGAGYTLIGQVGKVQKDEPEAEEETAEGEEPAEEGEEAAKAENGEKSEDEATFDNDVETEEEATEEPKAEEEPEVQLLDDEVEDDGMETDTSEDELDDLDLPSLGDEVDQDDVKKDEDDDEDKSKKESLTESVQLNALAEEAWMMNRVISAMNDEDAYYGSWLYIWPDGESREACAYDFGDQESFDELKEEFESTYKYYHSSGLYDADPEVLEYAHRMDSKLGLTKIENILPEKVTMRESYECNVAGDVFKAITNPENVDKIIVFDISDEKAQPSKDRIVYQGNREDLPMNIVGSPCKSFDVADGYLSCNIDSEIENTNRPLNKALECFNDDKTEKVLVWDQAKGEEVFSGTKKEACDRFGNCEFISFETPAVVRICINNPSILSCDEDECQETDVSKLIKKIIDANNLSQYKTDKPATNEYWIKNCIEENDDVEMIYETFVKPLGNKALIREFKAVTGYNNPIEEAYEAGMAAANRARAIRTPVRGRRRLVKEAAEEKVSLDQVKAEVDKAEKVPEETPKKEFEPSEHSKGQEAKKPEEEKVVTEKLQLDSNSDQLNDLAKRIHDEISKVAPDCKVVTTDRDAKIYVMFDTTKVSIDKATEISLKALADEKCEPETVDKKEDKKNNTAAVIFDKIKQKTVSTVKMKAESVRSFKTRKELAEAVDECKNNSQPYSIKRSVKEGYRYDLFTEALEPESSEQSTSTECEAFDIDSQGYTKKQAELVSLVYQKAEMLVKAVKERYSRALDIHPRYFVVEILEDLGLIPESEYSEEHMPSVGELSDEELDRAIAELKGPAFEEAAITSAVTSDEFDKAAKAGELPYINPDALDESCEGEVCEKCGKCPCECVESEVTESLYDRMLQLAGRTKGTEQPVQEEVDDEEMVDVDTEQFDEDMRAYFDEAYDDTVLYTTTGGHVDSDGTIVLEGLIQSQGASKPITFTLTPRTKISESVEDKKAMLEKTMTESFIVTNSISEEKFEFKFDE